MGVDPKRIVELDWWEDYTLPGGALRFTATPAQHFSGRSLTDRNRTLWSSWVMTSASHRVFFSGDTGLTEDFKEIGRLYGPFDVVMLEIGAWHPSWGAIHLGPENALRAFEMLRGKALFPVHWSTFDLAPARLGRARRDAGAPGSPRRPAHHHAAPWAAPSSWPTWRAWTRGGARPAEAVTRAARFVRPMPPSCPCRRIPIAEAHRAPFPERMRLTCRNWAAGEHATPPWG
jgi:hypothetical protein